MQRFPVQFSRNPVTVGILVTVPLLTAAMFVTPVIYYPHSPDWLVMLVSILIIGVAAVIVKYLIERLGSVEAEVVLEETGISVRLLQRSPFYRQMKYVSTWSGIRAVSSNIDPRHGIRFYTVSFRDPRTTIVLTPREETGSKPETAFGEALTRYVAKLNVEAGARPNLQIRKGGFFGSWWAIGLTVIVYLMIPAATVMRILFPERVGNRQLLQLLTVMILWLGTYYANRPGRSR